MNSASRRARGPKVVALSSETQPVPRFAPTTIQMESAGSISPPATDSTVSPTTTDEDCTSMVSATPKARARAGLESASTRRRTSGERSSGSNVVLIRLSPRKISPKWNTGCP